MPIWFGTSVRVKAMAAGVLLALAAGIYLAAGTNLVTNAWLLITEPANVIPTESSLWRFTPTVMNDGSGDWWIYGEDNENYYYFPGSGQRPYVAMSRASALDCPGFNSKSFRTWCDQ
jgi:hypothetical protein